MLADLNLRDFAHALADSTPAPGGGSAAAYAGAMAASLCAMVAGLSAQKKGLEPVWEKMAETAKSSTQRAEALTGLVDRDADAYQEVVRAMRLPKDSEEQKAARLLAIQAATILAAEIPLETLDQCRLLASDIAFAARSGMPACRTDALVAARLALAAMDGAWRNVAVNLDGIKDAQVASGLRERAEAAMADIRNRLEPLFAI